MMELLTARLKVQFKLCSSHIDCSVLKISTKKPEKVVVFKARNFTKSENDILFQWVNLRHNYFIAIVQRWYPKQIIGIEHLACEQQLEKLKLLSLEF